MKRFSIQIKVDDADPTQVAIMQKQVLECARTLFTTATLIAGRTPPQVIVESDDLFCASSEIDLLLGAESEEGETPTEKETEVDSNKDGETDQ